MEPAAIQALASPAAHSRNLSAMNALSPHAFHPRSFARSTRPTPWPSCSRALHGADDGELFLERSESEMLVFDDGRLKSAAYDATEGFGLRVVAGREGRLRPFQRGQRSPPSADRRRRRGPRAPGLRRPGRRRDRARPTPSCTARTIPSRTRCSATRPALLAGDRRLRPRPRPARGPGQRVDRRRAAGGGDPARRRPAAARRSPAGAGERLR